MTTTFANIILGMAMILGFKQMWWQLKVVIANLQTPRVPSAPSCPQPSNIDQDYCPRCGELVPVDQMGWIWDRYMCVRCARGRSLSDTPTWRT